jgi:hypothetical protein
LQPTDFIAPAVYSLLRSTRSLSDGPGFGFVTEVVRGAVGLVAVGWAVVFTGPVGFVDGLWDTP